MSGNKNSGRNTDIIKHDQCFEQFASGKLPLAAIAAQAGVSLKTVYRWKKQENWDAKLAAQKAEKLNGSSANQDGDSATQDGNVKSKLIRSKVASKLAEALEDPNLRPRKWGEVNTSLNYLEKNNVTVTSAEQFCSIHHCAFTCSLCELASVSEQELDKKIAQ